MSAAELIRELGYHDSPNFLQEEDFGGIPGYSHLFQRAMRGCQLKGVYTLADGPGTDGSGVAGPNVVPVVYVCEESPEQGPEEIHRLTWNQNVVPFVLVVSRDTVRLFSGFSYGPSSPDDEDGTGPTQGVSSRGIARDRVGVLRGPTTFNRIASQLGTFSADAIDRGDLWREWERRIDPRGRVDWRLLDNLNKLGDWLRGAGLEKEVAHSLIGKYVYLRYLRDRGILSDRKFREWGLEPTEVFGRNASLAGLRAVNRHLEAWLNGSVFPLQLGGQGAPREEHVRRVAGAFSGDDPETGQLHLDFEPYDFSFIPIETLSVIYEQFLHAEGRERDAGAYYTPVPLVNFMLQELEDRLPLREGMRVFDASCGSGAFLVQCYRRLIERRVRETGRRLRPSELRDLLEGSIFGVDRDGDACRVTELSLVLTMLDYVNPPDLRHNPTFRVPALQGRNIFCCDFFSPKCPFRPGGESGRFDWVVGNPPWVEVKKPTAGATEDANRYVRNWLGRHGESHPTGGNQAAQAFAWKLGAMLKPNGCAALLLPAKTLFNYESEAFRQQFFRRHHVWCVANFSNLTEVLFSGRSRVPSAAFYFSPLDADSKSGGDTLTYSPFVANQEANRPVDPNTRKDTWNIVINAGEIRRVSDRDAQRGDLLTWKVAMWGTPRDERLIRSVRSRFPMLGAFGDTRGILIREGAQLRSGGGAGVEFRSELVGKSVLKMEQLRGCGPIFTFPAEAVDTLARDDAYLRTRGGAGGLEVNHPPHVIIDDARRFAVYTDQYLVVPPRQIGISGSRDHTRLLKAISLYLVSDFATYYQFFTSPAWGVKRELATLRSLREIPAPFAEMGDRELSVWERLHRDAVRHRRPTQRTLFDELEEGDRGLNEVHAELNEMTYSVLGLTPQERWLVEDLARVRIELDEGKLGLAAIRQPTPEELKDYAGTLAAELDTFLGAEGMRHDVKVVYDAHSGLVQTSLSRQGRGARHAVVERASNVAAHEFATSRELLRRPYSQWVYFDRRLLMFDGGMTFLFKPLQRFHWTRGQALTDADLIISETVVSEDATHGDRQ